MTDFLVVLAWFAILITWYLWMYKTITSCYDEIEKRDREGFDRK